MAQPAAIIRIKNLRLRTFIGIKEEEIKQPSGYCYQCDDPLPRR